MTWEFAEVKPCNGRKCTVCGARTPVYFRKYSGEMLCARCFKKNIVERVRRTISRYDLLRPDDRILVAASGGKDSLALLKILYEIELDFPKSELLAVTVDEGIGGYREKCAETVKRFASSLGIPFFRASFKEIYGFTLSEVIEARIHEKLGVNPCAICGILRRKALSTTARRLGASVIATAHTLDDVVNTYLLNLLKGERNIKPVGLRRESGNAIPRVAPLRLIPEREMALYAYLEDLPFQTETCPYTHSSMRDRVRNFMAWYAAHQPEALYAFLSNFERMLSPPKAENRCEICGEPTSRKICRACELEIAIKKYLGLDPHEPEGLEREGHVSDYEEEA